MLNRPPKPVLTTVPSNLSALGIGCAHSPVLHELVPGQLPMAASVERVLDPAYTTGLGVRRVCKVSCRSSCSIWPHCCPEAPLVRCTRAGRQTYCITCLATGTHTAAFLRAMTCSSCLHYLCCLGPARSHRVGFLGREVVVNQLVV